mgnify:CR=1 FL=1
MTWPFIITSVIALASYVSTILSARISAKHAENMLTIKQEHDDKQKLILRKRELFENFLMAVSSLEIAEVKSGEPVHPSDYEDRLVHLLDAYYLLSPLLPEDEVNYFSEFCELVDEMDFSKESAKKISLLYGSHILPTIRKEIGI